MFSANRRVLRLSVSLIASVLLCVQSVQDILADGISVSVNPSTGQDTDSCDVESPCRSIAHAVHFRLAATVFLSAATFGERILVSDSVPLRNLYGSINGSVFDCSLVASSGPAIKIANTSISISGITFRNCANVDVSNGIGGALSAAGSIVSVSNCSFFNNTARTGGAIGTTSGVLVVFSCTFQGNKAVCLNASASRSPWGGAVGVVDALSVRLIDNSFSSNYVHIEFVEATSQASGGGGCVSIAYTGSALGSRFFVDANFFLNCHVYLNGSGNLGTSTSRYGNAYGGSVSLLFGVSSVASVQFRNATMSFSNNHCFNSGITAIRTLNISGNTYGGCLSIFAGNSDVNVNGNLIEYLSVDNMVVNIRNNTFVNCRASVRRGVLGSNVYGGGLSLVVGTVTHQKSSSSMFTHVSVNSATLNISMNLFDACSASSLIALAPDATSWGANSYGGAVSLVIGAYCFAELGQSIMTGNTLVSGTSFVITSNTLTACSASSATSGNGVSSGANVYGGGIALSIGAYSYSRSGSSVVSGITHVQRCSYTISSNTLTNCSASSLTNSSGFLARSVGANVYGGGISLKEGAYSYGSSSNVSGGTRVSYTSYNVSFNRLTDCTSSSVTSDPGSVISRISSGRSFGANVYGGGISLAVGPYSYCKGSNSRSVNALGSSTIGGNTTVENISYSILGNNVIRCRASSVTSGGGSSNGANVYGGGLSLLVGSYSYGQDRSSDIFGMTALSNASYSCSDNSFTNCSVVSVTFDDGVSSGTNVYGGSISLSVGAYSHGQVAASSGPTTVSMFVFQISSSSFTGSLAKSQNFGYSQMAFALGGAVSVNVDSYTYPSVVTQSLPPPRVDVLSSKVFFFNCQFRSTLLSTQSLSCRPGSASAAGGALFVRVPTASIILFSCFISESDVSTACAASSSKTYSVGGGVSFFEAGDALVSSSNFTKCFASGVAAANNVFVSGGGVHVEDTVLFIFENSSIVKSGIKDAYATDVLFSGGGAMGTTNVSTIRISNSQFYDNTDHSSTGVIMLQQLNVQSGMRVSITDGSVLTTDPLVDPDLPCLNISCGLCTREQQSRIELNLTDSTLLSLHRSDLKLKATLSYSISIPINVRLFAKNSFLNCSFLGLDSIVILAQADESSASLKDVICGSCPNPFQVSSTSSEMELSKLPFILKNPQLCNDLSLPSGGTSLTERKCPIGFQSCSTTVSILVGFWTRFNAGGELMHPVRCPTNYCGCRNIPNYNSDSCELFPILSPQFRPDDALCNGNRNGTLCGSCRKNFTQSLNGFSCISNQVCSENLSLVWSVSVLGFFLFSIYIFVKCSKSYQKDGFITCVLFFGQISSLASVQSSQLTSIWFSKMSQFESIFSLYENSCYALDLGAYEATAAQLIGPAIVLCVVLLLTGVCRRLPSNVVEFFLNYNFNVHVPLGAALTATLLLVHSNLLHVSLRLVSCLDIDGDNVLFIDGNTPCQGARYHVFLVAVVLLSVLPVVFSVALKLDKISESSRCAACSAYISSRYYWVSVTLLFRSVMAVLYILDHQSMFASLISSIFSVVMLVALIILRPYVYQRTHVMDVLCHFCLFVQFLMHSFSMQTPAVVVISYISRYLPFVACAAFISVRFLQSRREADRGSDASGVNSSMISLRSIGSLPFEDVNT